MDTRRAFRLTVALVLVAGAAGGCGSGPAPSPPPGQVLECGPCGIRLEQLNTLRGDALVLDSPALVVLRRADGEVLLSDDHAGTLLRFRPDGILAGQVGRVGSGPGEFRSVERILPGPGDSVLVFDRSNGRWAMLNPGLEPVRTFPALVQAVMDAQGLTTRPGLVVSLFEGDAGLAFHPFAGAAVEPWPGAPPARGGAGPLHLATLDDSTVWSVPALQYSLSHWSAAGQRLQTVEVSGEWLRSAGSEPVGPPDRVRPSPRIIGLEAAGPNRLWVIGLISAADWQASGPPVEGEAGLPSLATMMGLFDTVIDLVEVPAGSVVARSRVAGGTIPAGPGTLVRPVEGPSGANELAVFRIVWEVVP